MKRQKKAKYSDDSLSVARAHGCIQRHDDGDETWLDGVVLTPWGIVTAYSGPRHTRLDFVYEGRLFMRTEERGRTARGLAIMASKFAEENTYGR